MNSRISAKIQNFFKRYQIRKYTKGDILINRSTLPKGIFCITAGIVRCYGLSRDGVELTMNIYKSTSFFPTNWVMNGKQDRYYYEALSNVSCYIAPKEDFEKFIQNEKDVVYDLLKRIYRGLEGYFMRMESLLSQDAYLRVVTNILIHTLRFGKTTVDNKSIELHITHKEIASESGLSRETVTREIKKLQKKRIVGYKGQTLLVHNISRLKQEIFE